jgi:hypothetical protein
MHLHRRPPAPPLDSRLRRELSLDVPCVDSLAAVTERPASLQVIATM